MLCSFISEDGSVAESVGLSGTEYERWRTLEWPKVKFVPVRVRVTLSGPEFGDGPVAKKRRKRVI